MSPDALFRAAGEALYGPNWKSELGRLLEVDEKQIRRWAAGEYDPPASVLATVADWCDLRRSDLSKIEKALREAAQARQST